MDDFAWAAHTLRPGWAEAHEAKRFTAKQLHAIKLRGYQDAEAVMRQALDALIKARDTTYSDTLYAQFDAAIDALRKAGA